MEIVIGYLVHEHRPTWEVIVLCKSGASWSLGCYRSKSWATRVARESAGGKLPVFAF
jgi:hypothetical protein